MDDKLFIESLGSELTCLKEGYPKQAEGCRSGPLANAEPQLDPGKSPGTRTKRPHNLWVCELFAMGGKSHCGLHPFKVKACCLLPEYLMGRPAALPGVEV